MSDCSNKLAIIIETRPIDLTNQIRSVLKHSDYKVRVFHNDNVVNHLDTVKLGYNLDFAAYNKLLTDKYFWSDIEEEHILVFQHDSLMLRSGIEEYEKYDYVGAPWNWAFDPNFKDIRYPDLSIFNKGGNGGFSLRKRSKMLDILDKHSLCDLNEDMFFSKYIDNYPSLDERKRFCVETMFYEKPIGIHAINKYLNESQIEKIMSVCEE